MTGISGTYKINYTVYVEQFVDISDDEAKILLSREDAAEYGLFRDGINPNDRTFCDIKIVSVE